MEEMQWELYELPEQFLLQKVKRYFQFSFPPKYWLKTNLQIWRRADYLFYYYGYMQWVYILIIFTRFCFVENLYKSGKLTNAEYSVYCEWFKIITQNLDVGVDLIGKLFAFSELVSLFL